MEKKNSENVKKISTINQRVIQYIEYKDINKAKFYKDTGIANGTLDKSSKFNVQNIEKIITVYSDLDAYWLITGKGDMIKKGNSNINIDNSKIISEKQWEELIEYKIENKYLKEKLEKYEKESQRLKKPTDDIPTSA